MNKEEFLKKVKIGKYTEEDFILKFDTSTVWELLRTLPDDKFRAIEPLLKENIAETKNHKFACEKLIKDIEGGQYEL